MMDEHTNIDSITVSIFSPFLFEGHSLRGVEWKKNPEDWYNLYNFF